MRDLTLLSTAAGSPYDSEVLDWVARVVANGGTVSTPTKNAVQAWSTAITSIRSKIIRRNCFAGAGFAAAQVPFIKVSGGALDLPLVGALSAVGSGSDWTYNETGASGGLKPLTALAFLNTGCAHLAFPSDNSAGISVYVRETTVEESFLAGSLQFGGSNHLYLCAGYTGGTSRGYMFGTDFFVSDASANGLYTLSRTASNLATLYKNAVSIATTASPGGTRVNIQIGIFGWQANAGTSSEFCSKSFGGYTIHAGLDATEVGILNTAEVAFQTALTRQV